MNEKVTDTVKVVGANASALGIAWSEVNVGLTTFSLLVAIGYSIWKWKRDWNKTQKKL